MCNSFQSVSCGFVLELYSFLKRCFQAATNTGEGARESELYCLYFSKTGFLCKGGVSVDQSSG